MDCLKPITGGCGTPPNFAEKTFADSSQTSKSAKVFSLESFPLYGRPDTGTPRQSSRGTNSLADTFRRKEYASVHIPPG